jgi:hypothetical protein
MRQDMGPEQIAILIPLLALVKLPVVRLKIPLQEERPPEQKIRTGTSQSIGPSDVIEGAE